MSKLINIKREPKSQFKKMAAVFGYVCFFLVICLSFYSCGSYYSYTDYLNKLPRITSREELDEALLGLARYYVVYNAPISGQPAEDPFHILNEGQVAIYFQCEEYVQEESEDDDGNVEYEYRWERVGQQDKITKSERAFIYKNVPLNLADCEINGWEKVKDQKDFLPSIVSARKNVLPLLSGLYYPQCVGDFVGNRRYVVKLMRQNAPVTFTAVVGDGKVDVVYVKSSYAFAFFEPEHPDLFINGDMKNLHSTALTDYFLVVGCAWGLLFVGTITYKIFEF